MGTSGGDRPTARSQPSPCLQPPSGWLCGFSCCGGFGCAAPGQQFPIWHFLGSLQGSGGSAGA